jgi:protein associated with RNAse G/E
VNEVALILRKFDGRPHRRVRSTHLGEDDHGTWLSTPAGTTVHYAYGRRPTGVTRHHSVRLVPHNGWWIAMFEANPSTVEVYCDISLPPVRTSPHEFVVVDLDLDVSRSRTGVVELEDEDEFTENTTRYGYPPDVVTGATRAAATLQTALTTRAAPFGNEYEHWLTQVL